MAELVSDDMLDAFSVSGEYDEIADIFIQRYGGLLDEVNFAVHTSSPPEEAQIRNIIRQLQEAPVNWASGLASSVVQKVVMQQATETCSLVEGS